MKTYKYISIIICFLLAASSCSIDNSYGDHTDIDFPIPLIKTITSDPMVGDTITITGQYFVTPNTVSINGISMKIISQDSVNMVAVLPRLFEAAPIIIRSALGRYSENNDIIKPIYPSEEKINVTGWPIEITRGRPLVIRGTNMDLIKQVIIGSTSIDINGLTQQQSRLLVLIPSDISETESTIVLKTVVGTSLESKILPIIDYDPNGWTPIAPVVLIDFEDGVTHYLKGDLPDKQCVAKLNQIGITAPDGKNFFRLYATNITGSYSMWSYLGSLKVIFDNAVDMSVFHDPYISFLWNSDDNIGSFQLAVTQGNQVGGGTFAPGKTDGKYDPYAKLDAYTLRPTNKKWQWVTARLKDLIVENWGGGFSSFDNYGQINAIELVFKQINGIYWNGTWGDKASDIYDYDNPNNHDFKANIDQIMITDGPIH